MASTPLRANSSFQTPRLLFDNRPHSATSLLSSLPDQLSTCAKTPQCVLREAKTAIIDCSSVEKKALQDPSDSSSRKSSNWWPKEHLFNILKSAEPQKSVETFHGLECGRRWTSNESRPNSLADRKTGFEGTGSLSKRLGTTFLRFSNPAHLSILRIHHFLLFSLLDASTPFCFRAHSDPDRARDDHVIVTRHISNMTRLNSNTPHLRLSCRRKYNQQIRQAVRQLAVCVIATSSSRAQRQIQESRARTRRLARNTQAQECMRQRQDQQHRPMCEINGIELDLHLGT